MGNNGASKLELLINKATQPVEDKVDRLSDSVSRLTFSIDGQTAKISEVVTLWKASLELFKSWSHKIFWLIVALISTSIGKELWESIK